jgi:ferredoxin
MPVIFTLPDHTEVKVASVERLNLLGHAQMEEIDLGSRCGGWGECGGDRILITHGAHFLTPLTVAERELLTPGEIAQCVRLACQAFLARPVLDHNEIRVMKPGCG